VESNRSKVTSRSSGAALNWVDYLVLAASILTFLAVVAANNPHTARAEGRSTLITASELPDQARQMPVDPALIGARIRLTTGQL
jgi:hypothetical protein